MPIPSRRRRVDVTKLNPFDAADMDTINREWRRMQARKRLDETRSLRKLARRGWLRVAAVIATYLVIGAAVLGILHVVTILMLALFA